MRCLVTGAAGLIGSHLCEYLVAERHDVVAVDDLTTGRLEHLNGVFDRIDWDECSVAAAYARYRGQAFDAVFHLAGHVGVDHIRRNIGRMLYEHVEDTRLMLALARESPPGGATFLLASSSEVYGTAEGLMREQGTLCLGNAAEWRSGYGVSKALAEHLALDAYRQFGTRAVVCRFFNVAGPRQQDNGFVLARWIRRALQGEPFAVHDPDVQRCFTHVADVPPLLVRLICNGRAYGQVVNVGHDQPISLGALAALVMEHVEGQSRLMGRTITVPPWQRVTAPPDYGYYWQRRRVPDTRKLQDLVGGMPPGRVDAIVRDMVRYWRDRP